MIASYIPLHYLFKTWRNNTSHIIVTGFTVLISLFNIAIFVLKAFAMANYARDALCPTSADYGGIIAIELQSKISVMEQSNARSFSKLNLIDIGLSLSLVPTFRWILDAFLVSNLHYPLLTPPN